MKINEIMIIFDTLTNFLLCLIKQLFTYVKLNKLYTVISTLEMINNVAFYVFMS